MAGGRTGDGGWTHFHSYGDGPLHRLLEPQQ